MTAATVESPLRREAHGGFGERLGETDREQSRHRAPGLLSVTDLGVGYLRPAERRPSKVMSKAFRAAFQRLVQRARPRPVGSRLIVVR